MTMHLLKRAIFSARLTSFKFRITQLGATFSNDSKIGQSSVDTMSPNFVALDSGQQQQQNTHFASLFHSSKMVQLGDVSGRVVIGTITMIMDDDLYVDFGGKFEAVVKRPQLNVERYRRGSSVLLRLHDLELSERFLGSKRALTLLEADATLIRSYDRQGGGVETDTYQAWTERRNVRTSLIHGHRSRKGKDDDRRTAETQQGCQRVPPMDEQHCQATAKNVDTMQPVLDSEIGQLRLEINKQRHRVTDDMEDGKPNHKITAINGASTRNLDCNSDNDTSDNDTLKTN